MNSRAEILAGVSPKFNIPIARAPRITVKLSQERKVRSLAKNTLGSTRVGSAMRFPGGGEWLVSVERGEGKEGRERGSTAGGLEEWLV